ncbi:MAG: alanine-glyoxylate aminotransferase apoenzyme [uncultured archaeon A07HB70]|nr:MAG: alanine-glyoxylate aminotransferase apoenzyme [uncultured archaeon A07HB70]
MDTPEVDELQPPDRTMMGPGPSEVHPRVLRAMATPLVGHLDPAFVEIMDEVQELLRYVFRTDNQWTLPVSGTGSAAMETAIGNLVEPGDGVLLRTNGYWGDRMAQMAERAGGEVVSLPTDANEPIPVADVERAFAEADIDVVGVCHADTTTGIRQPNVAELTEIAHEHDAYVILDCVTSLGGVPVEVDEWGVDVAYSAAQKCLSCPPGVSPLTVSDRGMEKVLGRETDPRSWYLDLSLLEGYWGEERAYHHTAPITNTYALREALRIAAEEGIEARWARHERVAGDLVDGFADLGLSMNPPAGLSLASLNAVEVPEGVDDGAVIDHLREEYGIIVASGLGGLDGDIWRIGCMGYGAREKNVTYVLEAFADALAAQGYAPAERATPL